MSTTPFIVSLTGPSCAGKSTLEQALKTAGFENVISTTTRAPRAGEIDGQSYYFIDKSEFKRLRDTGAFIETVEFNGNYYGVLASEIERLSLMGKPIVVIVEPEGLRQIVAYCRTHDWPLMKVFVGNPGVVIAKRFLERFVNDVNKAAEGGTDAERLLAVRTNYANRLGVMLETECWWAEDVAIGADLWLKTFDERNIEDVVNEISRQAVDALSVV